MKETFTQHLISQEYKTYRKVYNRKSKMFTYEECTFNHVYARANFNTIKAGGIDVRFVKDNDFGNEIVYGLSEYGKPPTLICPRPNGILNDDQMNEFLNRNSNEETLKAINQIFVS